MSKDNNTVVARYPHAQEEGTYATVGDIVKRWQDVQVHYEEGGPVEVRTYIKVVDYGNTWDKVYHWSYVRLEGEWVGLWKHTWTYG